MSNEEPFCIIDIGDKMENLSSQMRPFKLEEIVGQDHLIGKDKILTNFVKTKHPCSMILYGPPGTGKTSIAKAFASELGLPSRFLNATLSSKQDFIIAIEEAKMYGTMLLVIDEIHRMNKDKQDILLSHIESGLLIIIGLTTANPYYKINPAIRSRVQILEVKPLKDEDIITLLKKALKKLPACKADEDALKALAKNACGDARNALNLLETAYYATESHHLTKELLKSLGIKPVFLIDANEDGHYDALSALQKSIRGSDVDASLHYLARLIAIEDLDSIYRRLSVIVYEDIGLANPALGPKLLAAIEASKLVGLPEARIPLGTIVTEMALSPKSNSAHLALDKALNDLNQNGMLPIPSHLKTNSKDYLYPHDYPNAYVKQQYLPDYLKDRKYYQPHKNKYEDNLNKIAHEMKGE